MRAVSLFVLSVLIFMNSCSGKGPCINADDCQADEFCINEVCRKKSCYECTISDTRCVGEKIQTCEKNSAGCLSWGVETSCSAGQRCLGDKCVVPQSGEGNICSNAQPCQSGLLCVRAPGDQDSTCSRRCVKSSDCPSGKGCFAVDTGSRACARLFEPPIDSLCRVKVEKAIINGGCWDLGCGAPDPYVTVKIGSSTWKTTAKKDSFNPVWGETMNQSHSYVNLVNSMQVELGDEDLSEHDSMAKWSYEKGLWVLKNFPRGKTFTLKSPDGTITLYVNVTCSF